MESEATSKERAKVAQGVVMLMLQPDFGQRLANLNYRDADGGVPIIAAGADESAVVTLHRIESADHERMMLASMRDGRIRICNVDQRKGRPALPDRIEIVGGTTVWDWMSTITADEDHAQTFYSAGSDIMPTAAMVEYAL
ncbi:hypothetical protein PTW37_10040 [Arthrobacter agilis]|uniref:hypothetical protein n=1 Tax=Arthrobacter agilis TaxID=37921 RepID=UPI0023673E6E|nr:hypothetical protein [Arthrobacter agilis]WDF32214.1 hypothetical protein PTW37_10040 [Arthrobacter agilis]